MPTAAAAFLPVVSAVTACVLPVTPTAAAMLPVLFTSAAAGFACSRTMITFAHVSYLLQRILCLWRGRLAKARPATA